MSRINPRTHYSSSPQRPRKFNHQNYYKQSGRRSSSIFTAIKPQSTVDNSIASGLRSRFEELGYNYGFAQTDPERNAGYCFVYRTLKNKLDNPGTVCRIKADERQIRLTELEGPFEEREKITIFTNDIISYYKFNHHAKFVAICIDANRTEKTGYWFLCFDREGQVTAFCEYLNWIFGLDSASRYCKSFDGDQVSYVSRQGPPTLNSSIMSRGGVYGDAYSGKYRTDSVQSKLTETESCIVQNKRSTSLPKLPRYTYPQYATSDSMGKRRFKRW